MAVKLLTALAGDACAFSPGQVVDLGDKAWEKRLLDKGHAEPAPKGAKAEKWRESKRVEKVETKAKEPADSTSE